MAWQLTYRPTHLHCAVSAALLCSFGSAMMLPTAKAATLGKTTITSAQHEPLVAIISVSDIKSSDFSANLANPKVYQQLGLTPTDAMSVRFIPTSASSGQLMISTSQPVSKPFADVVLAIKDNGQRNTVPKTLLMPLDSTQQTERSKRPERAKPIIASAPKPNLPVISAPVVTSPVIGAPTVATNSASPLAVKRGAPPPLFSQPTSVTPPNLQGSSSLPVVSVAAAPKLAATPNFDSSTPDNSTAKNNTLNIEVSRQITVRNSPINKVDSTDSPTLALNFDENMASLNSDNTAKPNNQAADDLATVADSAAADRLAANNAPSEPVTTEASANSASVETDSAQMANYRVQRNDNLWIISKQIADQNNLDISAVMTQIKKQNPNAFINHDADQLKADAELRLPNYEVIPSQSSIQTAIAAQRAHYLQANNKAAEQSSEKVKANEQTKAAASVSSQIAKAKPSKSADTAAKTTTQKLPQARFSVVAPGRKGQADGTQTKSTTATGNGLSTEILASLKSSRQRTAAQAQRTKLVNNSLGSYTQKLQLQNQKLAELEARLKKLRNQ